MQKILAVLCLLGTPGLWAEWTHMEYGGANVSSGNTVADPRAQPEERQRRYQALYDQLEKLVRKNPGVPGIFYVNDYSPRDTAMAANLLYVYAQKQGWPVQVRAYPGDFFAIPLIETTTASLRNPEQFFFENPGAHQRLVEMANHTREGLEFVSAVGKAESFGFPKQETSTPKYVDPRGNTIRRETHTYAIARSTPLPRIYVHEPQGLLCPIAIDRLSKRN